MKGRRGVVETTESQWELRKADGLKGNWKGGRWQVAGDRRVAGRIKPPATHPLLLFTPLLVYYYFIYIYLVVGDRSDRRNSRARGAVGERKYSLVEEAYFPVTPVTPATPLPLTPEVVYGIYFLIFTRVAADLASRHPSLAFKTQCGPMGAA